MAKFRKALLFALCILPIALVGGFFTGLYQLDVLPDEIIAEAIAELGSTELFLLITAIQSAVYALVCGFFGYILSDKIGLWKSFRFEKKNLVITLIISLFGGIVFSLDYWTFGRLIEAVGASYSPGIRASELIASILYGGIVEELMLRLLFMSLLALVIWKLFYKNRSKENIPTCVFVIANILAALVFAALHLPSTMLLFGELTPLILLRCFLLNGGFGLIFGWLYRKYGIWYSMLSHVVFHIVSKLIWFIFI